MKKVLVVLNDETLLSMFKKGTETASLFVASDNAQALEILQSETIDLLITELYSPGLDCAELMAAAASGSPAMKIVILLAINNLTAEDCKRLRTFKSIYFALKPGSDKEVENFTTLLNVIEHQALPATNISTADFFKLIECQKKTCLLAIEKNSSQRGLVYFQQGVLYDAISGLLQSEAAVSEILTWKQAQLVFRPPVQKQIRRKVFFDLDEFIAEQIKSDSSSTEENALDLMIEELLKQAEERIKQEESKVKNSNPQPAVEPAAQAQIVSAEALSPIAINISQLELENFLGSLRSINDYFACSIFDLSGNIITQHAVQNFNVATLTINIAALVKTIEDSSQQIGLGEANFVQIHCNNNIAVVVWNPNHPLIAILLLKAESKLAGLAKMNLINAYQSILKHLDN